VTFDRIEDIETTESLKHNQIIIVISYFLTIS